MTPGSASIVLSAALLFPAQALCAGLAGNYRLWLEDADGDRRELAGVQIRQNQEGFSYRIDWDDSRFENHFLSMRPFKCLSHPQRLICRLPYPYSLSRVITESDFVALEYDLLFLHKVPGEYGINAWNGLYFKLHREDGALVGVLHETDLNVLQAPPDEGVEHPIDPQEIYPASEALWPRRLRLDPLTGEAGG
jgi:hypothetical protein